MDLAVVFECRGVLEIVYEFIVDDSRDIIPLTVVSIDIFIVFQPTTRGLTADYQSALGYWADIQLQWIEDNYPNLGVPWDFYSDDSD